MQRMHQSYKCMKSQQNKLSGCASNLLAHEDLGQFQEAHHWNIQAKFYNEKFPLVYESDNKGETLYHEDHGATLKHRCEKRMVTLSLVSFTLIFFGPSLFLFPHMGQCSNNEDHHTFIYLQLKNYNSILEQNMTLDECLRRCTGMSNDS